MSKILNNIIGETIAIPEIGVVKHLSHLLFLLAIAALLCVISCDGPPTNDNAPIIKLDDDTRAYCFFKEGSWWVYEDSLQGLIDSVYCTVNSEYVEEPNRVRFSKVDEFTNEYTSSYYQRDFFIRSATCDTSESGAIRGVDLYSEKAGFRIPIVYFDPSIWSHYRCGQQQDSITFLEEKSEYQSFENVRVFKKNDLGNSFFPMTIYWAKNVGILKKVMPDGTVWTLKRHNAIQ